jgi:CHAP domain-containing protein
VRDMSRASVASLLVTTTLAASAAVAAPAQALPAGYGKGPGYCSQFGNYASSYSYKGVYACAGVDSDGPTPFDSDKQESFQCVELSARFLWAIYGIWAGPGTGVRDGADLVSAVHHRYPEVQVGYPAPHSVPVAGDVISLGPGGAVDRSFGHTAIVISDDQRDGHFRILGQNFPPGRAGEQLVQIDLRGRHNGRVRLGGAWTAASYLELRSPPSRRRTR